MAGIEVLFNPSSGEVVRRNSPDVWKIIVENGGVSVLTASGAMICSAKWSGKGLGNRQVIQADQVDSRVWSQLEKAVRAAEVGQTDPIAPTSSDTAETPAGIYDEIFVDLSDGTVTGQAKVVTGRPPRNAFEWKVVIHDGAVEISDHKGMFARARWAMGALHDHEVLAARQADINDYQWTVVGKALESFMTGDRMEVPRVDPVKVEIQATGGGRVGTNETRKMTGKEIAKGVGSGWWAWGAAAIALVAFLFVWRNHVPGDSSTLYPLIGLGVVSGGLVFYGVYGWGTKCPSCSSWYRRETTSREETGRSTYWRTESTSVKDSSGNTVGSTSQQVQYEKTTYLYHYKCKNCSHRWSATSSSSSRV